MPPRNAVAGLGDRLVILGNSASGKSTLARALGTERDVPVVHLDRLYYAPGWRPGELARFRATVDVATRGPRWIVDGNFVDSIADLTLGRADSVVFLDVATWRCVARAFLRTLRPEPGRADLPAGCADNFDPAMFADILAFGRVGRPRILAAIASHGTGASTLHWDRHDLDQALAHLPT